MFEVISDVVGVERLNGLAEQVGREADLDAGLVLVHESGGCCIKEGSMS